MDMELHLQQVAMVLHPQQEVMVLRPQLEAMALHLQQLVMEPHPLLQVDMVPQPLGLDMEHIPQVGMVPHHKVVVINLDMVHSSLHSRVMDSNHHSRTMLLKVMQFGRDNFGEELSEGQEQFSACVVLR